MGLLLLISLVGFREMRLFLRFTVIFSGKRSSAVFLTESQQNEVLAKETRNTLARATQVIKIMSMKKKKSKKVTL